jgi:ABC-2 type transport system ATP-binding protein
MTGPLLALHGVTKSFGPRRALDRVSLAVGHGEVVGLIGPNGSGKTTLLRILVGLAWRDAGDATLFGFDPAHDGLPIRRRTSYLPGETSLYGGMTGRAFLDFALAPYPRRHDDLLAEMLRRFELPLRRRIRSYSAGMKQKLALLATLAPAVELYLLDEPDRALDASARLELRALLGALRERGATLLLSSHHLSEVEALAQRLEFLIGGRLIPAAEVEAARAELRAEVRLRLAPGTPLPPGAVAAETAGDGLLRVRVAGEPLRWLQQFAPEQVLAAELGMTRLEDLYRRLAAPPEPLAR